jgi:hypothetical protein
VGALKERKVRFRSLQGASRSKDSDNNLECGHCIADSEPHS